MNMWKCCKLCLRLELRLLVRMWKSGSDCGWVITHLYISKRVIAVFNWDRHVRSLIITLHFDNDGLHFFLHDKTILQKFLCEMSKFDTSNILVVVLRALKIVFA
ncbi:unnamed protein product [Moneuplotes crassus]|uniref:Uncharacterized protein n=1 Tax=Euplotes crassus TaxID=5936 RepID=A0AAD1XTP2_EUPCR|nr:unnamed protein product [Moneuplotes crassus]